MRYKANAAEWQPTIKHIVDTEPEKPWMDEVCTVWEVSSPIRASKVVDALNLRDELSGLPRSATKKQIMEIISKYTV